MSDRPLATTLTLPTHLEGRAKRGFQAAWVVVVACLSLLCLVGFFRAFSDPMIVAMPPLTAVFLELGLDFRLMIALALLLPWVATSVIAWIVFWRRPDDPMALLFTMAIFLLLTYSSRTLITFDDHWVLRHAVSVVFGLGMVCLSLVLALFPDGRPVPPLARWLPVLTTVLVAGFPDGGRVLLTLLETELSLGGREVAFVFLWCSLFLLGLAAQVHRFRHVSGVTERQQTKWVMAPLGVTLAVFVVVLSAPILIPQTTAWVGWALLLVIPLGISIPIGVGNAVLRHRLYSIDHVVSRTVSYAVVLALLASLYAAAVVGLGTTVTTVTGEESSDLVIAASVLLVAGAFQPVRKRVLVAVDRRFNRSGHARRVALEEFSERLHDQMILDQIRAGLVQTLDHAFHPEHISIWMADRDSGGHRSGDSHVSSERSRVR